jgi:hypothetical protein
MLRSPSGVDSHRNEALRSECGSLYGNASNFTVLGVGGTKHGLDFWGGRPF